MSKPSTARRAWHGRWHKDERCFGFGPKEDKRGKVWRCVCRFTCVYIYIYAWNPKDICFWRSTPENKAFSNQNKGHLGSRYVSNVYLYIMFRAFFWLEMLPRMMWRSIPGRFGQPKIFAGRFVENPIASSCRALKYRHSTRPWYVPFRGFIHSKSVTWRVTKKIHSRRIQHLSHNTNAPWCCHQGLQR